MTGGDSNRERGANHATGSDGPGDPTGEGRPTVDPRPPGIAGSHRADDGGTTARTTDPRRRTRRGISRRWLRRAVWLAGGLVFVLCVIGWAAYAYWTDTERIRAGAERFLARTLHADARVGSAEFLWPGTVHLRDIRLTPRPPATADGVNSTLSVPTDRAGSVKLGNGTAVGSGGGMGSGRAPAERDRTATDTNPGRRHADRAPGDATAMPNATAFDDTLTCREVTLRFRPISLLLGQPELYDIRVVEPTIRLARRAADSDGWARWIEGFQGPPGALSRGTIPSVTVDQARVVVSGGERRSLKQETVVLSLTGRPSPGASGSPGTYEIRWRSADDPTVDGRAVLDVSEGRVETVSGNSPWLSIEQVAAALDAVLGRTGDDGGRLDWCRRMGLSGRFRIARCQVRPAAPNQGGLGSGAAVVDGGAADAIPAPTARPAAKAPTATTPTRATSAAVTPDADSSATGTPTAVTSPSGTRGSGQMRNATTTTTATTTTENPALQVCIELDRVRVAIPLDQTGTPRPPQERYLRTDNVRGTFSLSADGASADLTGRFHGAEWTATVTWPGMGVDRLSDLPRSPFRVDARVDDVALPREDPTVAPSEAAFIQRIPALAKMYARYHPSGRVDLTVTLTGEGDTGDDAGSTLRVPYARLIARGCRATYFRFPYPSTDITGTVLFTPVGVFVDHLQARHGTGTYVVNAYVASPVGPAASRVDVRGTGIFLDDDLYAALSDRHRRVWDRFKPSGPADIRVTTRRPGPNRGRPNTWKTEIICELQGVSATYDVFPYRLDDLQGRLRIGGGRFELTDIRGRHGEADLQINGFVDQSGGALTGLELAILGTDMPVTDDLIRALPDDDQELVAALQPQGRIRADARVFLDSETSRVSYRIDVQPDDLSIRPRGRSVTFDRLAGHVIFLPDRLLIQNMTGLIGRVPVSMNGDYNVAESGPRLSIRSDQVRLDDDSTLDLLPENTRTILADWDIPTPVSVEVRLAPNPIDPSSPAPTRTTVTLDGGQVRYRNAPSPLTDVSATLNLTGDQFDSLTLAGRYQSAGRVTLNLKRTKNGNACTGNAALTGVTLDDVRPFLPKELRDTFADVDPNGQLDLWLDRIHVASDASASDRIDLAGRARIGQLSIPPAWQLTGQSLTATFDGSLAGPSGVTAFEGGFGVDTGTVYGRPFEELSGQWLLARSPDRTAGQNLNRTVRLSLKDMTGAFCDGEATGRLDLLSRPGGTTYELALSVADMDIETYRHAAINTGDTRPERADPAQDATVKPDTPAPIGGRADLRVSLEGRVGGSRSPRGGGQVVVRDAQLYRLPIVLAILHVINLTPPRSDAFQQAQARFTIAGDRVTFHELMLKGGALALSGDGSMTLANNQVDLRLATVSPHAWARRSVLGELLEGASRELVELHVTGTVDNPTVQAGPLRSLRRAWQTLFPKQAPKNERPTQGTNATHHP